jgi:hypothetical protein
MEDTMTDNATHNDLAHYRLGVAQGVLTSIAAIADQPVGGDLAATIRKISELAKLGMCHPE